MNALKAIFQNIAHYISKILRSFSNTYFKQGHCRRRATVFIFSFCIGVVTQLNGSVLGVLKRYYITKIIRELLIGNSRFLIYNSLNQLLYNKI